MRATSHSWRQPLTIIAFGLVCGIGALGAQQAGQTQTGQTQTGQGQTQTGQGQRGQGQGRGQAQQGQQNQQRDTTTQPVGTGTVSGAVMADDTGRPVRKVRVALTGGTLRAGKSATTDDQGNFTFTAVPAGQFSLTASKSGYVTVVYGQKKPNRPGTPVQVAEGQQIKGLQLRIPHGGVITGRVLDEAGDPTPGTQVRVMRYDMRSGEKQLQQAGSDQTDDRGAYRIYGLPPGDYIVNAVPRVNLGDIVQMVQNVADSLGANAQGAGGGRGGGQGVNQLANVLSGGAQGGRGGGAGGGRGGGPGAQALLDFLNPASADEQPVGYAPVYYPGTTASASASTVKVGVGEERSAIDFQLMLVATAKVEGLVTSPDGNVQGIQLTLVNEQEQAMGMNMNTARVGPDGKFSFTNIPPGQYSVVARGMVGGGRGGPNQQGGAGGAGGRGGRGGGQAQEILWGIAPVSVDGRNVDNISIAMQPGMTVSGHVVLEGTGTAAAAGGGRAGGAGGGAAGGQAQTSPLQRVRVNLQSMDPNSAGPGFGGGMGAQVDADGNFTITGVSPGRYMITTQAPGYTGKSAIAMGRDALDFPMEVKPSENVMGVAVTLSDKSTQLSGTLQDSSGAPTSDYTIIVFPSDNRYWQPNARRIQSTRPGTSGTFTIRNLPPGDYRLAAVTDAEPGEWFDPAFLEQLRVASTPISLAEGEKKTQDLRLGGGY